MAEFDPEVAADLMAKLKQDRRQFLLTDLQTCLIAVDRARFELSVGNPAETEHELEIARHGANVIERILSHAPEEIAEIEPKLMELKATIQAAERELTESQRHADRPLARSNVRRK